MTSIECTSTMLVTIHLMCWHVVAAGADGLFMVVDERGVFRDDNFQAAVAALQEAGAAAATKAAGGKGAGGKDGKGQAKNVSVCRVLGASHQIVAYCPSFLVFLSQLQHKPVTRC